MKKIPEIYVNKINKKIDNNDEVFYSYKESHINNDEKYKSEKYSEYELQNKIDKLFRMNDFIYKKKIHIKTKQSENDYFIISKCYDYLLTIDGMKIMIKDIIEIY